MQQCIGSRRPLAQCSSRSAVSTSAIAAQRSAARSMMCSSRVHLTSWDAANQSSIALQQAVPGVQSTSGVCVDRLGAIEPVHIAMYNVYGASDQQMWRQASRSGLCAEHTWHLFTRLWPSLLSVQQLPGLLHGSSRAYVTNAYASGWICPPCTWANCFVLPLSYYNLLLL